MNAISVSAPGKVILSGEHAVVYEYPGIYAAVNKRMFVTMRHKEQGNSLNIVSNYQSVDLAKFGLMKIGEIISKDVSDLEVKIDSTIPVGSGMGSSAALGVALTGAVFKYFNQPWDLKQIFDVSFEIEKRQHKTPSGGDNMMVTHGGFLKYRKRSSPPPDFESIRNYREISNLLVINSGQPKETTGEMVKKVEALRAGNPTKVDGIFSRIGEITEEFYRFLTLEIETEVGELVKENHRLLSELQVVSPRAQNIINKIEEAGGAAKISGAGGFKDGSGILLAFHDKLDILIDLAKTHEWNVIPVSLGAEGVRLE